MNKNLMIEYLLNYQRILKNYKILKINTRMRLSKFTFNRINKTFMHIKRASYENQKSLKKKKRKSESHQTGIVWGS